MPFFLDKNKATRKLKKGKNIKPLFYRQAPTFPKEVMKSFVKIMDKKMNLYEYPSNLPPVKPNLTNK